jgi:hypothetical protein
LISSAFFKGKNRKTYIEKQRKKEGKKEGKKERERECVGLFRFK